MSGDKS